MDEFKALRSVVEARMADLDAAFRDYNAQAVRARTAIHAATMLLAAVDPPPIKEPEAFDDVLKRVESFARRGQIGAVSRRDARRLLSGLENKQVSMALIEQVLVAFQGLYDVLIRKFFADWATLDRSGRLADVTRLLRNGQPIAFLVKTGLPIGDVLAPDGPQRIARKLGGADVSLSEIANELDARQLLLRWSFTSLVLATHVEARAKRRQALDSTWEELQDEAIGRVLLPYAARPNQPSKLEALPPSEGRLRVVNTLIAAGTKEPPGFEQVSALQGKLVEALQDPRWNESEPFWYAFRERHRSSFDALLQRLSSDDLDFFFSGLVAKDDERLEFWKGYLALMRRTVAVLPPTDHARLRDKVRAETDPIDRERMTASLARATQFKSSMSQSAAFCLYFDKCVIVEFSMTGNAAYVYARANFEAELQGDLLAQDLRQESSLKVGDERIVHNGKWQQKAREKLRGFGLNTTAARAT